MSSSDSEDDCYGHIAQKLESIKRKYKEDKIETTNLLEDSNESSSKLVVLNKTTSNKVDCEEISLDTIIAQNSKKRITRNSKRNADISTDNIIPTRRRTAAKDNKKANESIVVIPDLDSRNQSDNLQPLTPAVPSSVNTTGGQSRSRRRGRESATISNTSNTNVNPTNTTVIPTNTSVNATNVTINATNVTVNSTNVTVNATTATITPTNTTVTTAVNNPVNMPEMSSISRIVASMLLNSSQCHRGGRRRRTSRQRRGLQPWLSDLYPLFDGASQSQQIQSDVSSATHLSYPTYSVGNTAEYPDKCYNQPLFNKQTKTDDVIVLGENDPENDAIENEELSVKVYWQNREHVKFTIRRFQKLTQIFDFFVQRENVSYDKLFFTYNDKILKIDDTPDSITYSIVKFIDGGIIHQSVSKIVQNDRSMAKNGIKLKFQCQNVKKPFETTIRLDDKLAVAFMMCAEHLEKTLDKLKFYFDGDLVTGKSSPRELELEGGDCIDVKIAS